MPRTGAGRAADARTPWLVLVLCLLLLVLPAAVVVAGPLKSTGSPALLLGFAAAALVVLGFFHGGTRRAVVGRARTNPGVLVLLGYFFLQLFVYAHGLTTPLDAAAAASTTRGLLSLVASVGTGLYVVARIRTARQRMQVLVVVVVALGVSALVGLLQGAAGVDLRYALVPPGFSINADNELSVRDGFTRVLGLATHPIEFSVLMASAVPLALHVRRFSTNGWVRAVAVLVALLALAAIPASVSRSGVITLVAAFAFYVFVFRARTLVTAAVIGASAVVIITWFAPKLVSAVYDLFAKASQDTSISARTDDYAYVGRQFVEHPLLGIGLGANPVSDTRYLDNQWLQAIVQGGTLGLLAQAALFGVGFLAVVRALRRSVTPREREESLALGGAFAAIFVSGFTFDLFGFQQATLFTFIVLGLLWAPSGPAMGAPRPLGTVGPGNDPPTVLLPAVRHEPEMPFL